MNRQTGVIRFFIFCMGGGDDQTGWVQFGQVQHIADQTIGEGKAGPMIIVMPDANTGVRGYFNAADGSFEYEDFFFQELIPHIEKTYRVRSERRYRQWPDSPWEVEVRSSMPCITRKCSQQQHL